MSTNTSLEAGLVAIQAQAVYLDQGPDFATVVFYGGEKPLSVLDPANINNKLVTCTLPKPCFKSLGVDYIEIHQTDAATVMKAGVATWARVYNGLGSAYADFEVGAEITLANPDLALGSTLMINSFKLRPVT